MRDGVDCRANQPVFSSLLGNVVVVVVVGGC